jgi:hypothetical protein
MYKLLFLLSFFLILQVNTFGFTDSTCLAFVDLALESDPRPPDLPDKVHTDHFIIHYNASQTNSVYANNAAAYAEFAYEEICIERGWPVPPPDDGRGGDDRYDIYILSGGEKGICKAEYDAQWQYE